jgi:hypothetical protein
MAFAKILAVGALISTVFAVAVPAGVVPTGAADLDVLDQSFQDYLKLDPSLFTIKGILGETDPKKLSVSMTDILNPEFRAANGLPTHSTSPVPTSPLTKRWVNTCLDRSQMGHVQAAFACRDFMSSLTKIVPVAGTIEICYINISGVGAIRVVAQALNGYTESHSTHVAMGIDWVIQNCTGNVCNCGTAGNSAAWGNGNLIVWVRGPQV